MSKFWKPGSPAATQSNKNQSNSNNKNNNNSNNKNSNKNAGGTNKHHNNSKSTSTYSRYGSTDENEKSRKSSDRNQMDIESNADANNASVNRSTSNSAEKKGLSKGVLSMKFMKRKNEEGDNQEDEATKKKKATELIWMKNNEVNSQLTASNSLADCKLICEIDLTDTLADFPGRRSFGGFNKSVERHYQKYLDSLKFDSLASSKTSKYDVDDEEMLERYQSLIGLPRGPNQGKKEAFDQHKHHSNKKIKSN